MHRIRFPTTLDKTSQPVCLGTQNFLREVSMDVGCVIEARYPILHFAGSNGPV